MSEDDNDFNMTSNNNDDSYDASDDDTDTKENRTERYVLGR